MLDEGLYLLMVFSHADATGCGKYWESVDVPDLGRILTRPEAEASAAAMEPAERFLLPFSGATAVYAEGASPPCLGMLRRETIWDFGEPTMVDLLALLREVVGETRRFGDRATVAVRVAALVEAAAGRFGPGDPDTIELHLDALVMNLGGSRVASGRYRIPVRPLLRAL
jgi:hypothetical protein